MRRAIFVVDPEGVIRYRKVALVGLGFEDADDLQLGARSGARRGLTASPFEVDAAGSSSAGSGEGSGRPVVLVHGLTAHRDLVVHGSRALSRRARMIRYDARGHGESDPGPEGSYVYDHLADDLDAVVGATGVERPLLAGHSMGAHTIANLALRDPSRWGGIVLIGPASIGVPLDEESLANWDLLAAGVEADGSTASSPPTRSAWIRTGTTRSSGSPATG